MNKKIDLRIDCSEVNHPKCYRRKGPDWVFLSNKELSKLYKEMADL